MDIRKRGDIEITDATVTLSNCCYMRGPIFKLIGELETTLSEGSDEDAIWLSVEIDAITGSAELITGTMADVTDQSAPELTSTKLKNTAVCAVTIDGRRD